MIGLPPTSATLCGAATAMSRPSGNGGRPLLRREDEVAGGDARRGGARYDRREVGRGREVLVPREPDAVAIALEALLVPVAGEAVAHAGDVVEPAVAAAG